MRKDEAESLVAEDSREEARAARERSYERRRQWRAVAQPLRLSRRVKAREGEWMSANCSGGGGGRGRALLVSRPAHACHAAAEPCRLAMAARRGRPSRMDAGAGAGRGKARWWAGPASANRLEARPRPASARLFPFPFF